MRLSEAHNIIEQQWAILSTEYGKIMNRAAYDQLVRNCSNMNPAVFAEAVSRHIADASEDTRGNRRGSWPPRTADINGQAHHVNEEQRREDTNRRFESDSTYRKLAAGDVIELTRSKCPECSDRGMTAFWYDRNNLRAIFLKSEAMALPDEAFNKLTSASAICDCHAGACRPERDWRYQDHNNNYRHTIPRLEALKKLSTLPREANPTPINDYFS